MMIYAVDMTSVCCGYNIILYRIPTRTTRAAPEIRPRFNFFLIGCAHP